jgi:hypothetical protein
MGVCTTDCGGSFGGSSGVGGSFSSGGMASGTGGTAGSF